MATSSLAAQISHYELAIAQSNCSAANYWWLGISYLLAGDEAEAQAAWFTPFSEADGEDVELLTAELVSTLRLAAQQQAAVHNNAGALLLRQHLQEIAPYQLENVLTMILLSSHGGQLTPSCLQEWELATTLAQQTGQAINQNLLAKAFRALLMVIEPENVQLIMGCLDYSVDPHPLLMDVQGLAGQLCQQRIYDVAIPLLHECLNRLAALAPDHQPNHYELWHQLAKAYSHQGKHDQAIAWAKTAYQQSLNSSRSQQIQSGYVLPGILMEASAIESVHSFLAQYRTLIDQVIAEGGAGKSALAIPLSFFPYIEDQPAQLQLSLQQAGQLFAKNSHLEIQQQDVVTATPCHRAKPTGVLRIGYIASTLHSHPVGWLSRWLWQYHDAEKFQVFTYSLGADHNDPIHRQWFQQKSTMTYYLPANVDRIVAQIQQDQIDVLVDLDSVTSYTTYQVMARRAAPVQVTWLGWDASGATAVDYFIADQHVLPAQAEDYYSTKIWRLPHSYVALDGFEVGTPTLRRETLGIPASAVVYYSAQVGYKLHPDTVRLQLEILRQVPGSYLLVKTRTNVAAVKNFYEKLAIEMGVEISSGSNCAENRLRFLDKDPDEATHRANLQIADVMLDSFPYNGATTTLETLWLGIPLVTRVGEQFAARNSYTFMINAGLSEGIAWTAEEYVHWGVRYGNDATLRQQVAGKLLDGRSTAPLWQARQFTQEMEQAYREMWNQKNP